MRQFSMKKLRQLPETSLPTTTPPWPSFIVQPRMMKFSEATPTRRPSLLRPDLMAMQSSPVSKTQFSMSTSRHDSGSQPSLLGPWETMLTPRTVTLVQSTGWISHMGERLIVTPSISTLRQRLGWMKLGRRNWPAPKTRCATGTSRSP